VWHALPPGLGAQPTQICGCVSDPVGKVGHTRSIPPVPALERVGPAQILLFVLSVYFVRLKIVMVAGVPLPSLAQLAAARICAQVGSRRLCGRRSVTSLTVSHLFPPMRGFFWGAGLLIVYFL
jgi:hypothetical protein